ncbi:hypothetical protein ABW21_db0206611 [Orbilia brochopaga]|nr:hypothetical protein ABW21_db0206611 [Drechslerella brochopaga]
MEHILQYASNLAVSPLFDNASAISRGFQSTLRGFYLINGLFETDRRPCKVDFERYLHIPKTPPASTTTRYKLLNYTKKSWLQHCRTLYDLEVPQKEHIYPKFVKLCFEQEILVDVRPWGKRYSRGPYPYTDAFIWAVENDHWYLLSAIFNRINQEQKDHYLALRLQDGSTPIFIAASRSTSDSLDRLLSHKGKLDLLLRDLDSKKRNLLHIAALHGSVNVSKYLLQRYAALRWIRKDVYENTPLDYALERDDLGVIDQIMRRPRYDDNPEAFYSPGWSTDGISSWKLERMFLLACSAFQHQPKIYAVFKSGFNQWFRNVLSADNECLLRGMKAALEHRSLPILFDIYIPAIQGSREGKIRLSLEMRRLLVRVFQLAVDLENSEVAQTLLREYEEVLAPTEWQFRELCQKRPIDYSELGFMTQFPPFAGAIPRLLALYYNFPKADEIELTIPREGEFKEADIAWLTSTFLDFKYSTFKVALEQQLCDKGTISPAATKFFWHNLIIALHIYNFRRDQSIICDLCDMGYAMLSSSPHRPNLGRGNRQNVSILLEILEIIRHFWNPKAEDTTGIASLGHRAEIRRLSTMLSLIRRLVTSLESRERVLLLLTSIDTPVPSLFIAWMMDLLLLVPIRKVQELELYEDRCNSIDGSTLEDHPIFDAIHMCNQLLAESLRDIDLFSREANLSIYPMPEFFAKFCDMRAYPNWFDYLSPWAPEFLEALLMLNTATSTVYSRYRYGEASQSLDYSGITLETIQQGLYYACNLLSKGGLPRELSERQLSTIYHCIRILLVAGADPSKGHPFDERHMHVPYDSFTVGPSFRSASASYQRQVERILHLFRNLAKIHSDGGLATPEFAGSSLCTSKAIWAHRMNIVEALESVT